MAAEYSILSHWCKLIESFQMSPLEFYSVIEQAVSRRQVPNIEVSRVDWKEGGVFSAQREYLRISRGRHVFDICGAPFGTGFFVSAWFVRPEAAHWIVALILLFISAGLLLSIFVRLFGVLLGLPAFLIGFPMILWLFGVVMNEEKEGWDDSIVAIPILGPVYERIFRPETYYKMDTVLMFQQAVHNAVVEAVDQVTSAKGMRALSDLERQPALMHFAKGAGD